MKPIRNSTLRRLVPQLREGLALAESVYDNAKKAGRPAVDLDCLAGQVACARALLERATAEAAARKMRRRKEVPAEGGAHQSLKT